MKQAAVAEEPRTISVAIYERVSSDGQREKETIQTQTFLVERYLSEHPELGVRDRYLDDGVSGSIPLAQRPQGRRLVRDVTAGRFQKLVVTRGDRLGRDARDLLGIFSLFEGLGVELVGITESLDDYLAYGVKAVVSDHERRRLLQRAAEGKERIVRQGHFPGGFAPVGYVLDGQKPHQRLVVSESIMWGDLTEAGVVPLDL
jgi:site-specific DNA recombinase